MVLHLLLLAALPAAAQPVAYRITSGGENRIAVEVEKTGLMSGNKHVFHFSRFQGALMLDPKAPEQARVELQIESGSVECKDTWVSEKDLKKIQEHAETEMLAVKRFPEIRFISHHVTAQGGNRFQVEGTLTIRDIGKPVTADVTLDPQTLVIDGASVFKMTGYGMKPPKALLGLIGTKDEMTVTFRVKPVAGARIEGLPRSEAANRGLAYNLLGPAYNEAPFSGSSTEPGMAIACLREALRVFDSPGTLAEKAMVLLRMGNVHSVFHDAGWIALPLGRHIDGFESYHGHDEAA